MKISMTWLRELVPAIAGQTVNNIAARLTRAGLEVESITPFGEGCESLLVAEVVTMRAHPARSGLRLVSVKAGEKVQEVVCGAPNVPGPGSIVILAPLGALLPKANHGKGLTIAARDIGGITSDGMLCSESEMGLVEGDSAGILALPAGTFKGGSRWVDCVPTSRDDILEIGLTPNRADGLGHLGIAKEVAALFSVPFVMPALSISHSASVEASATAKIVVDSLERCPLYCASVIDDVNVSNSPLWLKYRLQALGIRSISNVVDISNLIMMLYGQPLHTFDLHRIDKRLVRVRTAKMGEQIKTLDSVSRELCEDDLLICDGGDDGGKAIAIAGIMGGENTEIQPETSQLLLESAYFSPRSVRRSSRRMGLHTEASHRFERGVDPECVLRALRHATSLLCELTQGTPLKGEIIVRGEMPKQKPIILRPSRMNKLLGLSVDPDNAVSILTKLGCMVRQLQQDDQEPEISVIAPSSRQDLHREVDLIEEVARVIGYDEIPTTMPKVRSSASHKLDLATVIRHVAQSLGLSEMIHFAFCSPGELAALHAPEPTVFVANPLGEERSVMRTSLLPGLLGALRRCRNRGERNVFGFEVGAIFLPGGPEAAHGLCDEVPSFASVFAGNRASWPGQGPEVDIWDIKGIATELVERMTAWPARVQPMAASERLAHLHPRGAAWIFARETRVGSFGPLHPDVVDCLDLGGPAFVIELNLRTLEGVDYRVAKFKPLSNLPAARRDLALEVREEISAASVVEKICEGAGALCDHVEIFDIYRGKGIADGTKSIAFRLTFRHPAGERTLTDSEVDDAVAKAVLAAKKVGATLRN